MSQLRTYGYHNTLDFIREQLAATPFDASPERERAATDLILARLLEPPLEDAGGWWNLATELEKCGWDLAAGMSFIVAAIAFQTSKPPPGDPGDFIDWAISSLAHASECLTRSGFPVSSAAALVLADDLRS